MKAVVVDTNVPVSANGMANHIGEDCIINCIKRLKQIQKREVLLLDDGMLILQEYKSYLSPSGQPGVGDIFMKWVWNNQANPKHCKIVSITSIDKKPYFREFPNDEELDRFDPADRKFVAVAKASNLHPPILNATDSDWWYFQEPLYRHGIKVEFICPELRGDCD
jgi:hypothetical protein